MKEIDPIMMEILSNAVLSICEEMGIVLSGTARSPLLRESGDFSCTLHSGDGTLVAQTNTLPALASLARNAVMSLVDFKNVRREVEPGDIYYTNHMAIGGSHLSDVKAISPLFFDGQIVAWLANCAHWPDVGGAYAGGYVCATDIFQEGLTIPPVRFFRRGELNTEVIDLVLNNVRAPQERLGDIRAQAAAIQRGGDRVTELIDKYGLETVIGFFDSFVDYTERRVRNEIRAIPNGIYAFRDCMDNDGIDEKPVGIEVKVAVGDDHMSFDFTGSDPQVRGPINGSPSVVWAGVNFAVRGITDPLIPINEGVYRPLEVTIPEGCWLNAKHPAPRQHSTHETGHRVIDCVLGALAQAVPERVPAAMHGTSSIMILAGDDLRVDPPELFMMYECLAGGFGGRPDKDGIDGIRTGMGNATNVPVELAEVEFSLVTEKYELIKDSGGPGKHRGGCGMQRIMRIDGPADTRVLCVSSSERTISRPYGLHEGKPGAQGSWVANIDSSEEEPLKGKDHRWLGCGQTFSACAPGGGGLGNPFDRSPDAVLEDVLEEKVSLRSAVIDYGVAIHPDTLEIDYEETARIRASKSNSPC